MIKFYLQHEFVVPRSVESKSQLLCISRQVGNVWALGDGVKPYPGRRTKNPIKQN
jgi:hypothetical protein